VHIPLPGHDEHSSPSMCPSDAQCTVLTAAAGFRVAWPSACCRAHASRPSTISRLPRAWTSFFVYMAPPAPACRRGLTKPAARPPSRAGVGRKPWFTRRARDQACPAAGRRLGLSERGVRARAARARPLAGLSIELSAPMSAGGIPSLCAFALFLHCEQPGGGDGTFSELPSNGLPHGSPLRS
jgi:hypothetical protein